MDLSDLKGVCFDKDGTLFDFAATWTSWAQAFVVRLAGDDAAQATRIGRAIGFDLTAQRFSPDSIVIAATVDEIVAALLPHVPGQTAQSLLDLINDEAAVAPQQPAVPLAPFLTDLRQRGLRLGLATNDAESPARAHLAQAGITHFFDFIAGYDTGFGGKPGAGQLLAFADKIGASPDQVMMVGDSVHDLAAGRTAGMITVAVLTGQATAQDLAHLADIVLPDIGHLPTWLNAQGAAAR